MEGQFDKQDRQGKKHLESSMRRIMDFDSNNIFRSLKDSNTLNASMLSLLSGYLNSCT